MSKPKLTLVDGAGDEGTPELALDAIKNYYHDHPPIRDLQSKKVLDFLLVMTTDEGVVITGSPADYESLQSRLGDAQRLLFMTRLQGE